METITYKDFSETLFWDTEKSSIDLTKNKKFIIQRVLTLGTLGDWNLIKKIYGLADIKEASLNARSLDAKTLCFCATIFDEPISNFRCYTYKQSNPTHWNY